MNNWRVTLAKLHYRPHRFFIWFITVVVMALGILSIPLLLWRDRSSKPTAPNPNQSQPQNLLSSRL